MQHFYVAFLEHFTFNCLIKVSNENEIIEFDIYIRNTVL